MAIEPYSKLRKYLLRNSDLNILITIWGLITLCLIFIQILFPDLISDSSRNSSALLIVNAQILATILAITMSFAILGLQYVSRDFTPKIMSYLVKSKAILLFFTLYICAIISNLFVASFPNIFDPAQFVLISYIILVLCLLSLVVFPTYVIRNVQPLIIIENIEKNIPEDFNAKIISISTGPHPRTILLNDPFNEFEQISIHSIRNNDYISYSYCISKITLIYNQYLRDLFDENSDSGYRDIWIKTTALHSYFLKIYKQILFEILNQNNERFLGDYLENLLGIVPNLFKLKSHFPIEEIEKHIHDIGFQLIRRQFQEISGQYIHTISEIIQMEFSNLPSGHLSIVYSDEGPDFTTMSEKEKDIWHFGEMTHQRFFSELYFLLKLSEKIQDEEFRSVIWGAKYVIDEMVSQAIERSDNEVFRRRLVNQLLGTLFQIQKNSLKVGIHSGFTLDKFLFDFLQHPENFNLSPFKDQILYFFKMIGKISIEYDDPNGISDLGRASRILIHRYPEITIALTDILIEYSRQIRLGEITKENIKIQEIKRELNSIEHQNGGKIAELKRKIEEEVSQI